MAKQCAIYFGYEEGEVAQTAFVPAARQGGQERVTAAP